MSFKVKSVFLTGSAVVVLSGLLSLAQPVPTRARDLGVPFDGRPGTLNAITDIGGVEVGQVTIVKGEGALRVGVGPVRTGVTAIHPRGKSSTDPVFAAWFALNASGEMTGTTWLEERGLLDGPILITNTHSVGVVRDAVVAWMVGKGWKASWHAPVVAETYDGALNDINGFHVSKDHALEALRSASTGSVEEGAVGGGTGMICNGFKGGIGTASRLVERDGETYTVGVLVQCNYKWERDALRIAGVSVGKHTKAAPNCFTDRSIKGHVPWFPYCEVEESAQGFTPPERDGSIIIVVGTDAPLLPHQLKRVAKRPSLALGRLGAVSEDGSGDIFIAFSTAGEGQISENSASQVTMHPNNNLSMLFEATVQATEEAIVNAMVAAKTMVGVSGLRVEELPEDQLRDLMSKRKNE